MGAKFIDKYQWMYAALSGYCAASLLGIASFNEGDSIWLQISLAFYALALPIFATLTSIFWIYSKFEVPAKNVAFVAAALSPG